MLVDVTSLLCVMTELFTELLDGRQRLDGEAEGRNLLEESSDGGRPLREKEDLLIGRTVVQHGEEELQERSHALLVCNCEIFTTCTCTNKKGKNCVISIPVASIYDVG